MGKTLFSFFEIAIPHLRIVTNNRKNYIFNKNTTFLFKIRGIQRSPFDNEQLFFDFLNSILKCSIFV